VLSSPEVPSGDIEDHWYHPLMIALELSSRFASRARSTLACLAVITPLLFEVGCARIMQDEVGVRRKMGAVDDVVLYPGMRGYNPFSSRIFKIKTRTVNIQIDLGLPSREGLTIRSEISILYRIQAEKAPDIMRRTGMNYDEELILPVFRSASADVCARFYAKDMHSSSRSQIEEEIRGRMMEVLGDRGFIIEAVLLKSISLPAGLSNAIESKLEAEQVAQRMEFELQRETSEVERQLIVAEGRRKSQTIAAEADRDARILQAEGQKQAERIRAEGTAEANNLINQSVTPTILKYRQIEAFRLLSGSQNAKVIITDGKTPVINMAAQ
jgi:prohibitin 1